MLTIDEAIDYLISDQIDQIKIKKTNILKNRTIITMDNINTINNNIIECFLFYLKIILMIFIIIMIIYMNLLLSFSD